LPLYKVINSSILFSRGRSTFVSRRSTSRSTSGRSTIARSLFTHVATRRMDMNSFNVGMGSFSAFTAAHGFSAINTSADSFTAAFFTFMFTLFAASGFLMDMDSFAAHTFPFSFNADVLRFRSLMAAFNLDMSNALLGVIAADVLMATLVVLVHAFSFLALNMGEVLHALALFMDMGFGSSHAFFNVGVVALFIAAFTVSLLLDMDELFMLSNADFLGSVSLLLDVLTLSLHVGFLFMDVTLFLGLMFPLAFFMLVSTGLMHVFFPFHAMFLLLLPVFTVGIALFLTMFLDLVFLFTFAHLSGGSSRSTSGWGMSTFSAFSNGGCIAGKNCHCQ